MFYFIPARVDVFIHFPELATMGQLIADRLTQLERAMSVITDLLNALETKVDKEIVQVQANVAKLTAERDALQQKVDEGVATPEEIARFEAIGQKIDAIDPTEPDVLLEDEE